MPRKRTENLSVRPAIRPNTPQEHHPFGSSRLPRAALCAATFQMEERARSAGLVVEPGEAADEGTFCHWHLPPEVSLDDCQDDERRAIEKARQYVAERTGGADGVFYEKKEYLHASENDADELFFTHLDVLATRAFVGIVIDLKFGRAELHADLISMQIMMAGASALEGNPLLSKVKCYVFQPRTGVEYTGGFGREDLPKIVEKIRAVIDSTMTPDPKPTPSPAACCYCPGKSVCPALEAQGRQLMLTEPGRAMTHQLAKCLDFASVMGPWIDSVKKAGKEALERGEVIPGWELGERSIRRVSDFYGALDAVLGVLTQEDFFKACTVSIPSLEKAYLLAGGGKKQLEEKLKEMEAIEVSAQKYLKRKDGANDASQ